MNGRRELLANLSLCNCSWRSIKSISCMLLSSILHVFHSFMDIGHGAIFSFKNQKCTAYPDVYSSWQLGTFKDKKTHNKNKCFKFLHSIIIEIEIRRNETWFFILINGRSTLFICSNLSINIKLSLEPCLVRIKHRSAPHTSESYVVFFL